MKWLLRFVAMACIALDLLYTFAIIYGNWHGIPPGMILVLVTLAVICWALSDMVKE